MIDFRLPTSLPTPFNGLQEQLHGLEEQLSNQDNEIEQLQEQLLQLTGDFKYNLKVCMSAGSHSAFLLLISL